jgi:hypothetical protein
MRFVAMANNWRVAFGSAPHGRSLVHIPNKGPTFIVRALKSLGFSRFFPTPKNSWGKFPHRTNVMTAPPEWPT